GTLDKDRITNPGMWNLLLRIGPRDLHMAAYSIVEENSLIYRRFQLDSDPDKFLHSLEEIIYDNPIFLNDFRRIYCVVQTHALLVIPSAYSSEDDREAIFKAANPEFEGQIMSEKTGTRNATIMAGVENHLMGFIRRTFHNAVVCSHLSSLTRFFSAKAGKGNNMKMLANLRESSVDVIIMQGGTLMQANTFSFSDPMDAVYYLLACRHRIGLDPHNDELLLAGDSSIREKVITVLRNYLARVMPAIFPPQMFKSGKDAMLVPFDLIVTPLLCE
ncbi:MAG: DUF3822 family protein, partial [Duncaniella sp.]|nr:DUF3822 family protein [Duncaniella sp.]